MLARRLFGAVATLGLASGPVLAGPVTTGLWDVSNGVAVVNHSGVISGSLITNMFGGIRGSIATENVNTLFRDDQPAGFVHFVQWQTPAPVTVGSFNLFAHDDATANPGDRGFTRFQLFARNIGTGMFDLLYEFSPAGHPYHNLYPDLLVASAVIPEVTAQEFRAEFTQFAPNDFPGPRIVELDAFGPSAVPEPSGLASAALGLAALVGYAGWRRVRPRRC